MRKRVILLFVCMMICFAAVNISAGETKVRIKAIGIPLADHYAGIVAFEKYRSQMQHADYQLLIVPGPHLVRAYFRSEPDADIAFNVCPMVMDMFAKKSDFRWINLIHRDGNALAINEIMNEKVKLPDDKLKRKPDEKVAFAFAEFKMERGIEVECAIPSPLATHATVFYKYMKDHNKTIGFLRQDNADALLTIVKPPKSPAYLKRRAASNQPCAFEQSLPWPDIAESKGYGHVAWYSKDVMKHHNGHVECIIIAKDEVIKKKRAALKEVIYYIHKAGRDIETARVEGGPKLDEIIAMIQNQIPAHPRDAIVESLRPDLMVINYKNMNINSETKESFRKIMNLAFEAGFY